MAELSQPATVERLLFWARMAGVAFLLLGFVSTITAGWLADRLDQIRRADLGHLEDKVKVLEGHAEAPAAALSVPANGSEAINTASPPLPAARQITAEQHARLLVSLEPYADTKVNLITVEGWEPGVFAHQVAKTLRGAGLNVRLTYYGGSKTIDDGITCYWSREAPEAGQGMIAALREAGLEVGGIAGEPKAGAALDIYIGLMPGERTRLAEPR